VYGKIYTPEGTSAEGTEGNERISRSFVTEVARRSETSTEYGSHVCHCPESTAERPSRQGSYEENTDGSTSTVDTKGQGHNPEGNEGSGKPGPIPMAEVDMDERVETRRYHRRDTDEQADTCNVDDAMDSTEVGQIWGAGGDQDYTLAVAGAASKTSTVVPPCPQATQVGQQGFNGAFHQARRLHAPGDERVQPRTDRAIDGSHADGRPVFGCASLSRPSSTSTGGTFTSKDEPHTVESVEYGFEINCTRWRSMRFSEEEWKKMTENDERSWLLRMQMSYYQKTYVRDGTRKVAERRTKTDAPLDTITVNRMHYEEIRKVARECGAEVDSYLKWVDAPWTASVTEARGRRISRRMMTSWDYLLEVNVVEETKDGQCAMDVPMFKVPKKEGTSRLIADCRKINACLVDKVPMQLDDVRNIINEVAKRRHMCQFDGRSYFYQFGLHPDVRKNFTVAIGGKRGEFRTGRLAVLPMGFKYAPAIAQAVSNVLVRCISRKCTNVYVAAWIDNFVFAADDPEELRLAANAFIQLCTRVNIELKSVEIDIRTSMQILGVQITSGAIAPSQEMREKLQADAVSEIANATQAYQRAGRILWVAWAVARQPMACIEEVIEIMSNIGKAVLDTKDWNTPIPHDWNRVLQPWAMRMALVTRASVTRVEPEKWIYADATPRAAGWQWDACGVHGTWRTQLPIFIAELLAMATVSAQEWKAVGIIGDNLGAVRAVAKGLSRSPGANAVIRKMWETGTQYSVGWVPTTAQRADGLSRGSRQLGHQQHEPRYFPGIADAR
jgi:hypothetical protein